jgi:hypothetical protein
MTTKKKEKEEKNKTAPKIRFNRDFLKYHAKLFITFQFIFKI